jgi:membrane-bound lytic murein transglycosylase B
VIPEADGATRTTTVAVRLHLQSAVGSLPPGTDVLVGYASGAPDAVRLSGAAAEIPSELVPIYRAAAKRYGVPWSVLAAINRVETSFGRNLSVSSAGAMGWMQFMPGTWKAYGTDANGDGQADPYDRTDAIFSAARLLAANRAATNLRGAVWLYNHSNSYVATVLELARSYADGAGEPRGVAAASQAADDGDGAFSPVALW